MRIAAVTDSITDRDLLRGYLARYGEEHGLDLKADYYDSGEDLISSYAMRYDLLFMDTDLRGLDGIATAERVRKLDENVVLLFIASSSRKAVQGYKVNAFSFMLKPVSYEAFSDETGKALGMIARRSSSFMLITVKGELLKADMNDMHYFESQKNNVVLHCKYGVNAFRGTLKEIEEKADPSLFVRCNSCYLVNLRYVKAVEGNYAVVAGDRLEISRRARKDFVNAFEAYIARTRE